MSIIYDALKKLEKDQQSNPNTTVNPGKNGKKPAAKSFLIYILVAVFGIFLANLVFGIIAKKSPPTSVVTKKIPEEKIVQQTTVARPMPVVKQATAVQENKAPAAVAEKPAQTEPAPPAKFVLNGLFFSDNLGYALVNNEIVKEGDKIGGAVVKRVSLEGVELEADGNVIKLNNAK